MTPIPVTAEELRPLLLEVGYPAGHINLFDQNYVLPDWAYIEKFGVRFRDFLFNLGLTYSYERFDCDKFAFIGTAFAKLDHGKHGTVEAGFAIGMTVIILPTVVHAVVGAVHREQNELVYRLYEPQPQGIKCFKEMPLSDVSSFVSVFM